MLWLSIGFSKNEEQFRQEYITQSNSESFQIDTLNSCLERLEVDPFTLYKTIIEDLNIAFIKEHLRE